MRSTQIEQRFFRLVFPLILTGILIVIPAGAEAADLVDRIVAVVNDDVIPLSELNELMAPVEKKVRQAGYISESDRKKLYMMRENALEKLIEKKLLAQEIKKASLTVSDKEIDDTIENIKKNNFITDEQLRASLANEGLTLADYRKSIKEDILRARLMNLKIKSKVVITKEEMKAYYDSHQDEYAVKIKYHLRNIIMKKPAFSMGEDNEALEKMRNIQDRLHKGESFAALARIYSESPLASRGGDLGKLSPTLFSPQIQEALKGLKTGEYTDILDTDQGYQIFYIEAISETSGKTLDEASPDIEKILYNQSLDKMLQSWLGEIKKESHIKRLM